MAVSVVDANSTRPDEKIPPLHRDMPPLPRLKGKIMLEKLDKHLAKNINSCNMSQNIMVAHKAIEKINELCDAVNEQQKQIDKMSFAILDLATPNGENKALESIKAESKQSDCPEQMGYVKLDSDSLAKFLEIHPQYNKNGMLELDRTRKALDKGMEHITGLNNMIESWLNLINSDLDQETKLHILKSAISAYVENKGGNNEK